MMTISEQFAYDVLRDAMNKAIELLDALRAELEAERRLSFRTQVAELEAERDELRAEIAAMRQQEPVAWTHSSWPGEYVSKLPGKFHTVPLYLAPGAAPEDQPAQRTPYNERQVAWELERTALGDGYYGNALRVAKDFACLNTEDRGVLDRYATGTQRGADHVALQDIALRIYAAAPEAKP